MLSVVVLSLNLLLTVICLLFYQNNSFLIAPAFALVMNQSYTIMHECGHNTFFRNSYLNIFTGYLMSCICFLPFSTRKYEHKQHHLWVGTLNEPSTKRAIKTFDRRSELNMLNFAWKNWIPVFAISEHLHLWLLAIKKNIVDIVAILLVTYLVDVDPIKILPSILLFMVLIEFFNLPHHLDAPIIQRSTPLPASAQADYGLSCKPIPIISKWLCLNFNYHSAHHVRPNATWYNLPSVEKRLFGEPKTDELRWHLRARKIHARKMFAKYRNHNT